MNGISLVNRALNYARNTEGFSTSNHGSLDYIWVSAKLDLPCDEQVVSHFLPAAWTTQPNRERSGHFAQESKDCQGVRLEGCSVGRMVASALRFTHFSARNRTFTSGVGAYYYTKLAFIKQTPTELTAAGGVSVYAESLHLTVTLLRCGWCSSSFRVWRRANCLFKFQTRA